MADPHVIDAHTVGLWRLDEASGASLVADAAGTRTLTPSGLTAVAGQFGNARNFAGSGRALGAYADAALTTLFTTGEYTIEAWVKLAVGYASNTCICSFSGTVHSSPMPAGRAELASFHVTSTRALYWEVNVGLNPATISGAATPAGLVPINTWTHVAVRVRVVGAQRTVDFFVGGVLVNTNPGVTPPYSGAGAGTDCYWTLGRVFSFTNFNGVIDDVRLSNKARSAEEVAISAGVPTPPPEPEPIPDAGYDTTTGPLRRAAEFIKHKPTFQRLVAGLNGQKPI